MLLKAQRFLGSGDGVADDFSMWPKVKPGARYWVKPIKGRIKKRMIVLAVAKRGWMGRNKRLIRNYIIKRVEEVKVRCVFYLSDVVDNILLINYSSSLFHLYFYYVE